MPITPPKPGPPPAGLLNAPFVAFEAQGFPEAVYDAFQDTADTLGQVILSRTPGVTTTSLIAARYDLKSFFIKSKSCDWGPMAGFVCASPWLNKKGAAKAAYNLEELAKYINARPNITTLGTVFRTAAPPAPVIGARPGGAWGKPFIPLRMPQSRVAELKTVPNIVTAAADPFSNPVSPIYGVAMNSSQTALTDFVLRTVDPAPAATPYDGANPEPLWELLHANIWVLSPTTKRYVRVNPQNNPFDDLAAILAVDTTTWRDHGQPYVAAVKPSFNYDAASFPAAEIDLAGVNALDTAYDAAYKQLESRGFPLTFPADGNEFVPLFGCSNPFPSYPTNDATGNKVNTYYRNAVSGDYDLFAVWPEHGAGSLVRESERFAMGALFWQTEKRFTLALTANPDVWIECIPGYAEIAALENPQYGNSNDAVKDAVQILNAMLYSKYKVTMPAPNVAFHSDEGGRPGVANLEYPVALFVPTDLVPNSASTYMLRSDADFLNAVTWLKKSCRVPIQLVWLAALAANARLLPRPNPDRRPPLPEAAIQALIIGAPPEGGYSAAQTQLYDNFLALVTAIFGVFNPASGEFAHSSQANPISGDITRLLALTAAAPAAQAVAPVAAPQQAAH